MRRTNIYFIFLLTFLLFPAISALPANAEKDVSGKTFYTLANIWYEKPGRIYSTNYHKGAIIPAGTKEAIKKTESVTFENGRVTVQGD